MKTITLTQEQVVLIILVVLDIGSYFILQNEDKNFVIKMVCGLTGVISTSIIFGILFKNIFSKFFKIKIKG